MSAVLAEVMRDKAVERAKLLSRKRMFTLAAVVLARCEREIVAMGGDGSA